MHWDFGDGNFAGNIQNPVHTYIATGPYNIMLTITSNNGCIDDTIRQLTTIYAQPAADFSISSNEVCIGSAFNFTDLSTAPNSSVSQWLWDFGDGTNSSQQSPSKTYAAPGTYSVTLQITSAVGCPSTVMTRQVVVNALPTANFGITNPQCAGKDITFTDASAANSGSIVKWTWNYGDGTNAVLNNSNPFIHNYTTPGSYNATLQVETDKGCTSSLLSVPVTVNVNPVAGFINPAACTLDPQAAFIDTSKIAAGNIASWQWNFGDPNANAGNPNTSSQQNPAHRYTVEGPYTATLIVTSNTGCTDTVAQT
ncbi:MAG: PKD domain-containing protein, partial [Bacteroidia bacterium]|nr:PKD domain-containing protein [Bacteroidia bacterium]